MESPAEYNAQPSTSSNVFDKLEGALERGTRLAVSAMQAHATIKSYRRTQGAYKEGNTTPNTTPFLGEGTADLFAAYPQQEAMLADSYVNAGVRQAKRIGGDILKTYGIPAVLIVGGIYLVRKL